MTRLSQNKDIITATYDYTSDVYNGFRVDVVIDNESSLYDAVLYHKDSCAKTDLFAVMQSDTTYNDFLETVLHNLPEYIPNFIKDHMM